VITKTYDLILWSCNHTSLIIDLCSFPGKASLAAANRHDMGHPETLVELPSTQLEKETALD